MNSHNPELETLMAEGSTVKVYGASVRLWHWITAFSIIVLAMTGYFIGAPLFSVGGEASDWYLMGYVRFTHFAFAYILAIAFVWRIYIAIIGNAEEREIFYLPLWSADYYKGVIHQAMYYGFMVKQEEKHLGHNPLARAMMFTFIVLGLFYMIFTGFALYGEGLLQGSWASTMFSWVLTLHGDSLSVHMGHRLVAWSIVIFAMAHVYVVVRHEILSRSTCLSVMFSGTKTFRA